VAGGAGGAVAMAKLLEDLLGVLLRLDFLQQADYSAPLMLASRNQDHFVRLSVDLCD
jgi:hypothetical protein